MDDVHLAQRCLADTSLFAQIKQPSQQFVDAYVQGFNRLERATEQHVDILTELVLVDSSVYGRFQQVEAATAAQKLTAALNYARCAGHFPDLKALAPYASQARALELAECLLHKEERELVEHQVDLVAFAQSLQLKGQGAILYLRQLKARAVMGAQQLLPLFLLRRLLPSRFEASSSQELQSLVFSIYQAVCGRDFNVDGIVTNLFYHNNGVHALPWAHFGVHLRIFKNIKTSVESLLFLCAKMDALAPDAFRSVIDTRMFKLLPVDEKLELFYTSAPQQWQRDLLAHISEISLPAAQLLFIYKLAQQYCYADLLPQFGQIQQFCAAQQLNKQFVADLKRLYAENNRLQLFWQEEPFDVCLTALFNAQKRALSTLQIIYMAFVGRRFSYYIIGENQFIDPQIVAAARRLSANFQEGVFLAQCSAQQRDEYARLGSLSYLIPVQAGANNLAIRTLHALNALQEGRQADFAAVFEHLLQFGDIYHIIRLAQQNNVPVKLPRERLQMTAVQREIIVGVLQSFYPATRDQRIWLLVNILDHEKAATRTHQVLLDGCPRALFHPKLYASIEADFERLKAAVEQNALPTTDDLIFPLQIGEHLQRPDELYVLCNAPLFVLLLFTGDFENELQLQFVKILLAMLQRYGSTEELYQAAARGVEYRSSDFYAKYVSESQILRDAGKQVSQARQYCLASHRGLLPIVTGQPLYQLLKQGARQAFFSFAVDVCFEINYKSLENVTEAEFLDFIQSTAFSSLGAFKQRDFTLPSLFGQKLPFIKSRLNEYTNIVKLRYENEALYEAVRLHAKSEFPDLARLLNVALSVPAQRSLTVLLNCRVSSVWKKLAEVRCEDDLKALVRNPYVGMMKKQQAARYAEIFALLQKCGEEGLRNISFE